MKAEKRSSLSPLDPIATPIPDQAICSILQIADIELVTLVNSGIVRRSVRNDLCLREIFSQSNLLDVIEARCLLDNIELSMEIPDLQQEISEYIDLINEYSATSTKPVSRPQEIKDSSIDLMIHSKTLHPQSIKIREKYIDLIGEILRCWSICDVLLEDWVLKNRQDSPVIGHFS
jgi:hypothetical protein